MYLLELIFRTIVNLLKQAWFLPRTIVRAVQQRRQSNTGRTSETERLDRIRHPWKYAGR
jgi:hypothetical protein